jgi:hypothetical protein
MTRLLICNKDLVETEYLKREYGLFPHIVDPNKLKLKDEVVFIACTDPSNWKQILLISRSSSIVFFLLGNETYDKSKYEFLNQFKSIRHVFIYNPPRDSSKFGFLAMAGWIRRSPCDLFSKHLFFACKFALEMRRKAESAEIMYPWSNLPLGYTNHFVIQLPNEIVNSDSSLVDDWPIIDLGKSQVRDDHVRFMGQIGTWYRRELVRYFSRFPNFDYVESSGWGKSLKKGYMEMLHTSTFILCPPGIFTNETFRYFESIICGALPIAPVNSLHDLHSSNYWSQILPFYVRHSHIEIYRYLRKLPASQIVEYQQFSRNLFESEIHAVRSKLEDLKYEKI